MRHARIQGWRAVDGHPGIMQPGIVRRAWRRLAREKPARRICCEFVDKFAVVDGMTGLVFFGSSAH
jgi:hypothetical protein